MHEQRSRWILEVGAEPAGTKEIGHKAGPGSWDWIISKVIDMLRN